MTPIQQLRLYQQVIARLSKGATRVSDLQLLIAEENGHINVSLDIGFDVLESATIEEVSSSKNND